MKKRILSLFLAITLCLTLTPTGALAAEGQPPEQMVTATQEAEPGADENAPPANPEENPTEDAPAAAEKNTADEETGKETGKEAEQNEPTVEGKNEPPALNDAGQNAAGGGIYVAPGSPTEGGGGTYIPGEDTRTEIWCVSKPDSIGRGYDGTTDGGTIPIDLTFTDGTNEIKLTEKTDFTAKKTFDSADAGWHTVTVEIALIGEAAAKYKLKAGEETFTIGGNINKAYPDLTVTLSKTACTAGEKLLPLLSVEGAPEDAEVTYYYLASALKSWAGSSDVEGSDAMPKIDENTAISEPGTYYVYAKTSETKNYKENRSATVALTVTEPAAASVTKADGTVSGTYESLPAALNAAQDGDTVTLLSDVDLGETYVTIDKSITFDLGDKTLSSSKAWLSYGVLLVKNATVTVKNGTVKAAEMGSCAICAYGSGASMTLENVTATVTSNKSSVTVGDFGSAVIKSGDYQGLYVGAKSQVTLEGGTFRPYMDTTTNKNVKSIFWKVNETTDATSRDCMELLGDGCVYVDENQNQVRTGGGFNTVVTVQQGTAIDAPVAKIGDVEYASLSKAIDAVQNGGTITLLDDLDLGNGAVLQVGSSKKDFTIDLDSHTLSADGACLIMLHNGSQLTLKNGTLDGSRCTSYHGVLYISSNSSPKLTLENVTAKSGSVADFLNGQRSVLLAYVAYGTVVFDGGTYTGGVLLETDGNAVLKSGTFQKGTNDYSIKTKDSGKHLSDYLDDDSQFWNDNTPLNLSNETQTADEVTVRPCKHKWENGKCTVCQKVCDHGSADGKSMTEDPCPTCGMKAAAQVDITGSDAKYFPSFTDALVYAFKNDGCTLKLLADVTGTTVMINNPFIFDLNGHSVDALSVDAKATIKDSGTTKGRIGKVTVSNEKVTDLTLGSLLEEGYAFKYGNGYWANDSYLQTTEGSFVTVEKAPIQSVNVYAKDKNNQEILTIAYGATGEVTLVSSCKLSETSGENLSCAWYKLTDDTAIPPLEGAAGTSYKLPADLPAGTYTYRVTFTSDYYSKSAEITITVTPISLVGATVTVSNLTYNGNPQEPTVTVKLGDETLSRDNDYTVQVTKQTDAGSYKLTIKGGGNYSGEIKDVEWKIEPMKIDSVMVSSDISKTYDGTATVTKTAEEWAEVLTFKTLSASGVVDVPSSAYTISDVCFVTKNAAGEYVASPEVGEKNIQFTVTFNNNNYVLQTALDNQPASSKTYNQSGLADFTITQATVTSPGEITQLVFNDLAKTYTLNLAALLPELSEGCEYGDIQYQGCDYHFTDSTYLDSNNGMSVSKEGILTLPTVSAHTSDVNTQIGTITVPVVTTNYQNFEFTIKVVISARIPLNASGVTVSASEITYGQTLNESKLTATGTMKHPGTGEEVKGTFAWENGTVKPDASDSYEAEWTFTPAAGYEEYAPATGTVTIKVKPAKLTVSVKASSAYYNGEAQIASIIASGQSVDSTPVAFTYSDKVDGNYTSGGPTFTDAGTYTAYYKAEAANHEPATGTFTVTIEPLPISLLSVSSISKSYDGSADVTLTADKLTFFSKTAKATNIKLPDTAITFTNAQFTKKQANGSYLPSPEVGGGKALSFTMMLTSNNYVFEGKSEGTTEVSDVFATDDVNRFTITKAAAPTDIQTGTLNVVNGTKLEYTYDAKQLLPKAPKGTYGKVSYNFEFPFNLKNGYYVDDIAIKDCILTLTIDALNGGETGKIGTIPVYVTTDNYASFNLPLDLYAVNKITPVADGEITAAGITYGDALSKSTISGTMKDPNTGDAVTGTFAWTDGTIKPGANDSYKAEWTFTPAAGYEKYATATGTVTIKVNKATPTFNAPTAQENLTYTGQEQALIIAGSVTSGGTMQYSLTENGTYSQDIPTGTDAGAYTVWYRVIGDANHNDTAPASVPVRIGKKPLTITGVTAASKTYDGTTNADITSVTFDNVTLNRGTDYTVTANFNDAGAGNGKNVTATVTLIGPAAKNYALEQSSFTTTGSITKAAAPGSGLRPAVTVINDLAKTYEMVLSNDYLPKLSSPCEYGNVSYSLGDTYLLGGYKDVVQAEVVEENGQYKLKLTVPAVDYNRVSSVGTLRLNVSSDNYQDFPLDIGVKAKNKDVPVPDGPISASDITYGQALNDSKIAGKMKAGGKAIDGTFTWTNGTFKPAAGDYPASWTFTPAKGYEEYATATGTATVTVNPKAVTVRITPNGGTYGETITPATVTANDVVGEDAPKITLTYTGTANDGTEYNSTTPPTKAGTYTIKASTTNANYTLDANTATAEFSVAKRRATVTPDNKSKVYQEKDPDLTYKVGGVLDGETLTGITLTRAEGENAGMYAITATADTGANPNYDVTFAEGTLTIEPKSIKGAKVVLGKALTANGAEQTQTVEKVLLDDKEIPADSYTVTGNTATAPGRHTLTITAKGNYTDSIAWTYVIAPSKAEDAPGEDIAIGNGKVKVDVKSEGTVPPATLLTNKAELLAMLVDSGDITADELAQIADGASVDIALTVKEANVSAEIKTAMAQAAKGCTIGQYLDISLFKYMTVNGKQQDGVALHTTKNALTISVAVPDALINTNSAVNRTYCIVRNHEGTITVLDAAFDAASKTLTFKTDRFSDYAIAYKDTAVPSSGSNPGSNNSSNGSETKKNEVAAPTPTPTPASTSKPSTITAMPQTGDTSNPTLYVVLLVASLLGLAVVFVCKKRNNK